MRKGKSLFLLVLFFLATALWPQSKPPNQIRLQYYNSPSGVLILPECIWAPAVGGGTWMTELQIAAITDISNIYVAFCYGGGNYRGPFTLASNISSGEVEVWPNILEALDNIDPDDTFSYYGKVGALWMATEDLFQEKILALGKTNNGPYGKIVPALADIDANFCSNEPFRPMVIGGLVSNDSYRSSVGGFNMSSSPIEITFELYDASGAIIGTPFTETFAPYDFKAFNPFNRAGVPYPTYSYDAAYLVILPESGLGRVMFFGATANNSTNDPATILPFQLR